MFKKEKKKNKYTYQFRGTVENNSRTMDTIQTMDCVCGIEINMAVETIMIVSLQIVLCIV